MDEPQHRFVYYSLKIENQPRVEDQPLEQHLQWIIRTYFTGRKAKRKGGSPVKQSPPSSILQVLPQRLWECLIEGLMVFYLHPPICLITHPRSSLLIF